MEADILNIRNELENIRSRLHYIIITHFSTYFGPIEYYREIITPQLSEVELGSLSLDQLLEHLDNQRLHKIEEAEPEQSLITSKFVVELDEHSLKFIDQLRKDRHSHKKQIFGDALIIDFSRKEDYKETVKRSFDLLSRGTKPKTPFIIKDNWNKKAVIEPVDLLQARYCVSKLEEIIRRQFNVNDISENEVLYNEALSFFLGVSSSMSLSEGTKYRMGNGEKGFWKSINPRFSPILLYSSPIEVLSLSKSKIGTDLERHIHMRELQYIIRLDIDPTNVFFPEFYYLNPPEKEVLVRNVKYGTRYRPKVERIQPTNWNTLFLWHLIERFIGSEQNGIKIDDKLYRTNRALTYLSQETTRQIGKVFLYLLHGVKIKNRGNKRLSKSELQGVLSYYFYEKLRKIN